MHRLPVFSLLSSRSFSNVRVKHDLLMIFILITIIPPIMSSVDEGSADEGSVHQEPQPPLSTVFPPAGDSFMEF